MTGTSANNFTTLLYNQINNSVGNTFLSNLQYKLQNDQNFNLSLADSLSSNTYGDNLSGLIYNKINESTSGNSVIGKLANNIATNPEYQTMLQGPPGDIADPIALERSMIPKTMWCSNGTFGNVTTGGLICRTPFSTSGSLYQIGNAPVYDNGKGVYLTPSGSLKIGDWILAQNVNGDLEIFNTNPKISNSANIVTNSIRSGVYNAKGRNNVINTDGVINTPSISSDAYHARNRNNVIDSNGNIDTPSLRSDAYHARNRNHVIDSNGNINSGQVVSSYIQSPAIRSTNWIETQYFDPYNSGEIRVRGSLRTNGEMWKWGDKILREL